MGGERIVYGCTEFQIWRLLQGNAPEWLDKPQHGFEESLKLKRNLLLSMLALIPAALMPLAASCQIAPERAPAPERTGPVYRWQAYAGFTYTSLNQVNNSRYGLIGVNASITRDFGKYFGITAEGADFFKALEAGNPVNATVYQVLVGPSVHVDIWGKISGFGHGLLGVEHTGGGGEIPNISFAGGFGGGAEYSLGKRLALRASGDKILSSFVEDPNHLGYSPHMRSNARAGVGVVYRF